MRESLSVVCLSIFHRERRIQFCLLKFTTNLMFMLPQLLSFVLNYYCPLVKTSNRKRKKGEGFENCVKMSLCAQDGFMLCLFIQASLIKRGVVLTSYNIVTYSVKLLLFFFFLRKEQGHLYKLK